MKVLILLMVIATVSGCEPGWFKNSQGECQPCPPGSSSDGSSSCELCPVGTANGKEGGICLPCQEGLVALESGTKECSVCPDGSVFLTASSCEQCKPGFYSNHYGMPQYEECRPCPIGFICPEGSGTPQKVPPGQFANETGQASGKMCPDNTYMPTLFKGYYLNSPAPIYTRSGLAIRYTREKFFLTLEQQRHDVENPIALFRFTGYQFEVVPPDVYPWWGSKRLCLQSSRTVSNSQLVVDYCDLDNTYWFREFGERGEIMGNLRDGRTGCLVFQHGEFSFYACEDIPKLRFPNWDTFSFGGSECPTCDPGTFLTENSCKPCSAGTISTSRSQLVCDKCPEGQSSEEGQTSCFLCGKGTFAPDAGSTCEPCRPGSYNDKEGKAACRLCKPGSYSDEKGKAECRLCKAGSFASSSGSVTCESCPPGTFVDQDGASNCTNCSAGFYSTGSATLCSPCPAGEEPNAESSKCVDCPNGAISTEGSTCQTCQSGYFTEDHLSCEPCPSNTFSGPASSKCEDCAAGMQSNEGRTDCIQCPVGSYGLGKGKGCDSCPSGTFSSETGWLECEKCPAGSSSERGSSSCLRCPPGSYAPLEGSTACLACPVGFVCPEGSILPLPVPFGEFADQKNMSTGEVCASGSARGLDVESLPILTPTGFVLSLNASQLGVKPFLDPEWHLEEGVVTYSASTKWLRVINDPSTCLFVSEGARLVSRACDGDVPTWTVQPNGHISLTEDGRCLEVDESEVRLVVCADVEKQIFSLGGHECPLCSAGTFSREDGATTCLSCPPGTTSAEGFSECEACSAGTFSMSNGSCKLCPTGFFCQTGDALPKRCPAGQFQNETGQTSCEDCQPGTSSGVGTGLPLLTGSNKVVIVNPDSSMLLAVSRTLASRGLSSLFIYIEEDSSFRLEGDETQCITEIDSKLFVQTCDGSLKQRWTLSADTGLLKSQDSVSCAFVDTTSSRIRVGTCESEKDTYLFSLGGENCKACEAGSFSSTSKAPACTLCEVGTWAGVAATGCVACPAGSFGTGPQSSSTEHCKPCPPGEEQAKQGQTKCNVCSNGFFKDYAGSGGCVACPPGTVWQNATTCVVAEEAMGSAAPLGAILGGSFAGLAILVGLAAAVFLKRRRAPSTGEERRSIESLNPLHDAKLDEEKP